METCQETIPLVQEEDNTSLNESVMVRMDRKCLNQEVLIRKYI